MVIGFESGLGVGQGLVTCFFELCCYHFKVGLHTLPLDGKGSKESKMVNSRRRSVIGREAG